MSKPVTVNIPHHLGKAEAKRRLEEGFGSIQQNMTGGFMGMVSWEKRWENDQLHFEGGALGQTISGSIHVLEHAVQIQINLPSMLAAIADRMKASLQKQTQRLLGEK
jgi:hypothetical protein